MDGDHPSPLTLVDLQRDDLSFLDTLLSALPYRLHPRPAVLLLRPMGGLDLLQALHQGAKRVVVVEENPLVLEVVGQAFAEETGRLLQQPAVEGVRSGPRSYLARRGEPFDLVVLSLTGDRAVVTAGAYSLSEEPLLTVEAFRAALRRLAPGGTLVLMRWLQEPPSEELRALATVVTALEAEGMENPAECVVALRSWSTLLLLARREPFAEADLAQVEAFAQEGRFDLVWTSRLRPEEANRYNRIRAGAIYYDAFAAFFADREQVYREWPADVRPARDGRPFFYHFFRWRQVPQVLREYGQTVQPFGGAGFLVLPFLLLLALLASGGLIVLPLALSRRGRAADRLSSGHLLLYFALLGLGFMAVEVPLLGRFTLLLDQPLYATATVLFALLVGSGLGSLLWGNRPERLRPVLPALSGLGLLYALGLPLLGALLALPLGARIALGGLLLLPLGFLMGVPFPAGLRLLGEKGRAQIPWAWAANGCASVLGAILAQLAALAWGYGPVLLAGALAYGLAGLATAGLRRRTGGQATP